MLFGYQAADDVTTPSRTPHSSISTPKHADAPPGACGRKPQRIDFSTPPPQRSRSLRRSARRDDARRQREQCVALHLNVRLRSFANMTAVKGEIHGCLSLKLAA